MDGIADGTVATMAAEAVGIEATILIVLQVSMAQIEHLAMAILDQMTHVDSIMAVAVRQPPQLLARR